MAEKRQASAGASNEVPPPPPKIEWDKSGPDPARFYVNMAQVHTSLTDLSIDMGQVIESSDNSVRASHQLRIMMSPQHAKAFLVLLANQIIIYEATFGKIPEAPTTATVDALAEIIRQHIANSAPGAS